MHTVRVFCSQRIVSVMYSSLDSHKIEERQGKIAGKLKPLRISLNKDAVLSFLTLHNLFSHDIHITGRFHRLNSHSI